MMCFAFVACNNDDDILDSVADVRMLCFQADGGTDTYFLHATGNWSASVDVPWLTVSPATGCGQTRLTITADSTLSHEGREGWIRIAPLGEEPLFIECDQFGYGNLISLSNVDGDSLSVPYSDKAENRNFEVKVAANVPFKVEVEYTTESKPWLTPESFDFTLDRGARPRSTTLQFSWDMNPQPQTREALVRFLPVDTDQRLEMPATLRICQSAAPLIEDNREGDSLAIVIMHQRLESMQELATGENMMYWDNVTLWEATDADLPCREAIGRVREVSFALFYTDETIPAEISHLTYVEQVSFYGNVNAGLKSIELGDDICGLKHLKRLQIAAYGLVSLPASLAQLGNTLEVLDINSNNFSDIPEVLTPENFPRLRKLNLSTCRRSVCLDLRNRNSYANGIGLHIDFDRKPNNRVRQLLLWNNLQMLGLSYNYLEGELPEFEVGKDGVEAWSEADVLAWGGDTIRNLIGMPKILPNTTDLRLNLNFFTGPLPQWILYHPHLLTWIPDSYIFTTQENGVNSSGKLAGFSNVPSDFDYYYDFFPGYREKYEGPTPDFAPR